jgi:prophage regulatory protein
MGVRPFGQLLHIGAQSTQLEPNQMSAKAVPQPKHQARQLDEIPERHKPPKILSYEDLKDRGIKFSRQWIVQLMKEGKFPKTVMLGAGHSVGFIESEIDEWIEKLIAERDDLTVWPRPKKPGKKHSTDAEV